MQRTTFESIMSGVAIMTPQLQTLSLHSQTHLTTQKNTTVIMLGPRRLTRLTKGGREIECAPKHSRLNTGRTSFRMDLQLLLRQQPGHLSSHEQLVDVLQEAFLHHLRISEPPCTLLPRYCLVQTPAFELGSKDSRKLSACLLCVSCVQKKGLADPIFAVS